MVIHTSFILGIIEVFAYMFEVIILVKDFSLYYLFAVFSF